MAKKKDGMCPTKTVWKERKENMGGTVKGEGKEKTVEMT